ncbi:uncharacterized protein HD556DRAFT_1313240 [Suillus plorans]|uniref:Uncharacterized protein n=1 Tax=Suillus plorans TaxID=116603 RepID=A0A9P7DBL9_9AGAM|nr:uncharacterized protein HD556DRAFT_1313240 [Suillus plorans]KAG1786748.1 hypothetical protein HD556DRAFT_1313240 [Suillus plorans]
MSMKEALEIETHNVGEIMKEKDALIQRIVRELNRANDLKEKEWERQQKGDNDEDSDMFINTDPYFNAPHASWHPMLLLVYLTILLMHLSPVLPASLATYSGL